MIYETTRNHGKSKNHKDPYSDFLSDALCIAYSKYRASLIGERGIEGMKTGEQKQFGEDKACRGEGPRPYDPLRAESDLKADRP